MIIVSLATMRISLSIDHSTILLFPLYLADALAKRLENLSSGLSSGIVHEAVRSRLDDLAENMTDLFMTLSQETSGLSRVLDIAEPLDHEVIKLAVRQSLDGFCNFYVTSAASKLGAEKAETLLAQLQRSEEEAEDLSQ